MSCGARRWGDYLINRPSEFEDLMILVRKQSLLFAFKWYHEQNKMLEISLSKPLPIQIFEGYENNKKAQILKHLRKEKKVKKEYLLSSSSSQRANFSKLSILRDIQFP
jgi:hypothetical protein